MARKATSRDVAERAGVSRSAVSMVLNGRGAGNIAPEKQAAIRSAAAELNYTPNSVALSLRNQRTHTLGVVTDAIATTAFGGRLLEGAARAAEDAGFVLVVMDTHADAVREEQAYRTLLDRRVDALAFAAMTFREYEVPEVMGAVPSVLANCLQPADLQGAADLQDAAGPGEGAQRAGAVRSFAPDEVDGGYRAACAVLEAGHRDVVLLAGTPDVPGEQHKLAPGLREQGYRRALQEAGLTVPAPVVAGWDITSGYRAASALLQGPQRPTAVLCANDRVAVGVVLAAANLGLAVPADLSVVGYDDDENIAPFMVPPLTTVQLPFKAMGEGAVHHLLDLLAGRAGSPARRVLLPCPLIERASVAPPR